LVQREEGGQLGVGLVDDVLGQVVARVHEAGGEAPADAVHHRPAGAGVTPLEPEEVDLEDLGHRSRNLPGADPYNP
jgi:hypothetical protein